jgi:hypothetical protein
LRWVAHVDGVGRHAVEPVEIGNEPGIDLCDVDIGTVGNEQLDDGSSDARAAASDDGALSTE